MCGTYHRMQGQPSVTSAKRHSQVRNSLTFNLGIKPETGPKKTLREKYQTRQQVDPQKTKYQQCQGLNAIRNKKDREEKFLRIAFKLYIANRKSRICEKFSDSLTGVTSTGYSCGICKYKAHRQCVSDVKVCCKWSTIDTVDKQSISIINVSFSGALYITFYFE